MTLLESLKGTYAVIGQDISDIGLDVLAQDLASYPVEHVQAALTRCRKELKRIALSDILDRLPGQHPGPEEAWAIVSRVMCDEGANVIWSQEMREAWGVIVALREDRVAARLAFKETYLRLIGEARAQNQSPHWCLSLGRRGEEREQLIWEGVAEGKLRPEYALRLLPDGKDPETIKRLTELCPRLLS